MVSRIGFDEIHPASLSTDSCRRGCYWMIRNNVVWIHGLIQHCLRIWKDKYGHFYACVCEMTGQGPPAPRKHVNNFRCDLFHDAGKTMRSGAMNTDRITTPWSKLWKYCHCRCGRSDRDDFTPLAHVLSHSGMVMRAWGRSLGAKDRSR